MRYLIALSSSCFLLVALLSALAAARSVRRAEVRASPVPRTPAGTEHHAAAFTELGFVPTGSLDVTCDAHDLVVLCLLAPDQTTLAMVTATHVQLLSTFEGRLLTTTNEPARAPLQNEIAQHVRASVPQLWATHREGIEAIGGHGAAPDQITFEDALARTLAIEERSIESFGALREFGVLFGGAREVQPLSRDQRAPERIGALLARTDPPFHS